MARSGLQPTLVSKAPGEAEACCEACLFPLYSAWWFAGYVQCHAVYAGDFVYDAVGDAFQEVVGEAGPVGGHGVVGGDGPNDYGVGVGSGVAHYADGVDGREDGEALPELAVEAGGAYFVLQDRVGPAEYLQALGG